MLHRTITQALLSIIVCAPVQATGSLDFKAGNYFLNMTVSLETYQVVSPIRFSPPQAKIPFELQPTQFKTFRYDVKRQRFLAVFVNPENPALPKSFTFSVRGKHGVLSAENKRIPFSADWQLQ